MMRRSTSRPGAGGEDVVGALPPPRRRRVHDDRPPAPGRPRGCDRPQVDTRRDHVRLRHPADRVVAADDLGAGLLPEGEVLGGLPADVGAEVVHHRRLPERAQERELERLRDERQPEDEVEQVGARDQLGERAPLGGLTPDEPAVELERAVGLRVELVAVEDDERRLDPAPPERLDVRPRDARGVDGAMDDAERALPHVGEPLVPPRAPSSWLLAEPASSGPPGRRSRPPAAGGA